MIANEKQVFQKLTLGSEWVYALVLLVGSVVSSAVGGFRMSFATILIAVFLLRIKPDRETYQALGLGDTAWKRHRRYLLWLYGLIFSLAALIAGLAFTFSIYPVVIPLAIALIRSLWVPDNKAERVGLSHNSSQLQAWGTIWFGVACAIFIAWMWEPTMVTVIILIAVLIFGSNGTFRRSLRDWVALGGLRKQWLRRTMLGASINTVIAIAFSTTYALLVDGDLDSFLAFSIFIPLTVIALDLAEKKTMWLPALGLCLGFGAALSSGLYVPLVVVVGLSAMIWQVSRMVLKARIFTGGFAQWMGMAPQAV